jgi:hypothetical protein
MQLLVKCLDVATGFLSWMLNFNQGGKMKKYIFWLVILIAVSGCSFKEFNAQVERQNHDRFLAFSQGMAMQTTEGGRLALSLMYATGAGQQALVRPETARDYIGPINALVAPWIPLIWHHGSDDDTSQAITAGRDVYLQATNNSTHAGHEMFSAIHGDGNSVEQYVCPDCPDGTEGEAGISGGDSGLSGCQRNPPGGWQGGLPLYRSGCSCRSHFIDEKC